MYKPKRFLILCNVNVKGGIKEEINSDGDSRICLIDLIT